jgi:hypothetical protein
MKHSWYEASFWKAFGLAAEPVPQSSESNVEVFANPEDR